MTQAPDSTAPNTEQSGDETSPGEGRIKRKFARYSAPMTIEINAQRYQAINWSLGGFQIGGIHDLRLAGDRVKAKIIVEISDFDFSFETVVEIVRLDTAEREAGFRFIELTDKQIRALSFVSAAFLSGRLRDVGGLLRYMGSTTDAAAKTADGEKEHAAHPRTVVLRWLALGILVLVSILSIRMAILGIASVEASAAWVDAPVIVLSAPDNSIMSAVRADEGDIVEPGAVIAGLVNRELDAEIDYAQAERDQLAARLAALQRSMDDRNGLLAAEMDAAKSARERAQRWRADAAEALRTAQSFSTALRNLSAPEFVSLGERSVAEQPVIESSRALAEAEAMFDQAGARILSARSGYFYGDARTTGFDPADLAVEIPDLEKKIAAEDVRIAGLEARRAEFQMISPCYCKIIEIAMRQGERAGLGEPVVRLRAADGPVRVAAFVRHRNAGRLHIGDRVTVRLADGRLDARARIEEVRTMVRSVNESKLLDRDLNPERFTEVTVRLSEGFEDAPAAAAQTSMIWSPLGWLERAFYISI